MSSARGCNRAGPVGASVVLVTVGGKHNGLRGRMRRRRGASVKMAISTKADTAWRNASTPMDLGRVFVGRRALVTLGARRR